MQLRPLERISEWLLWEPKVMSSFVRRYASPTQEAS